MIDAEGCDVATTHTAGEMWRRGFELIGWAEEHQSLPSGAVAAAMATAYITAAGVLLNHEPGQWNGNQRGYDPDWRTT